MTDTRMTAGQRRNAALFAMGSLLDEQKVFKQWAQKDGKKVLVLKGVPVFRSGTFRDSMGFQHTWDDLHMSQMKLHYDDFVSTGIFADVPVRKGHGSLFGEPMDGLIGYHTGLVTEKRTNPADGKEYTYLLADFEILDPDAAAKIDSGLWRNRSAEIGAYVTNDEVERYPTYKGVAYVDIPAVEGLNGFSKYSNPNNSIVFEEAPPVSDTTTPVAPVVPGQPTATATAPAVPELTDAQRQAEEDRKAGEQLRLQGAAHAAARDTIKFSINGQETNDYGKVQSHIALLEESQRVVAEAGREAYCRQLAADNKVMQVQVDGLIEYTKGLDVAGYAAFQKLYEGAPAQAPVGQTAGQQFSVSPQQANDAANHGANDQLEIDKGIVKQHLLIGTPEPGIQKLDSFKRVLAAEPTFQMSSLLKR